MANAQPNLQLARTAIDGFLSHFGGHDEDARNAAVQAAGSVAVSLAVSSDSAEGLFNIMQDLLEQPQKLAARGLLKEAAGARYLIILATAGAFLARTTVETVMLNELKEGVPS